MSLRLRKLPGVKAWAVVESSWCYECDSEDYLAFGKTARKAWRNYCHMEKEREMAEWTRRNSFNPPVLPPEPVPGTYEFNLKQVNSLFGTNNGSLIYPM